jgi:peptidoglycan/LPS O-acetylase OafA/YrhL
MAGVVLAALLGGALLGCLRRRRNSLVGVAILASLTMIVVLRLVSQGQAAEIAALLAVATFMFSLVIGTAAALLTHRLRGDQAMRGAQLPGGD